MCEWHKFFDKHIFLLLPQADSIAWRVNVGREDRGVHAEQLFRIELGIIIDHLLSFVIEPDRPVCRIVDTDLLSSAHAHARPIFHSPCENLMNRRQRRLAIAVNWEFPCAVHWLSCCCEALHLESTEWQPCRSPTHSHLYCQLNRRYKSEDDNYNNLWHWTCPDQHQLSSFWCVQVCKTRCLHIQFN